MGIGENVGENVGESTGSSGSTYEGVTPVMTSISGEVGSNLITINFNTGIQKADFSFDYTNGFDLSINGVPVSVGQQDATNAGNGVLIFFRWGFSGSFSANDALLLTYDAASLSISSILGNILMADQIISTTISSFTPNLLNVTWEQYSLGNLQEQNLTLDSTSMHNWGGVSPNEPSFHDVVSTPTAYQGTKSLKFTRPATSEVWGGNALGNYTGVTFNAPGEMWISVTIQFPSADFAIINSDIFKFIRVYTNTGDWWLWRLKDGGGYDTQTKLQGAGGTVSFSPTGNLWNTSLDTWVQFEMYLKMDTNSSNNVERYYRNGTLLQEVLGRPSLSSATNLWRIQFWPEWHQPGNPTFPRDYWMYCDNVKVTDGNSPPSQTGSDGNLIIGTS
jgi:hypothetical protein